PARQTAPPQPARAHRAANPARGLAVAERTAPTRPVRLRCPAPRPGPPAATPRRSRFILLVCGGRLRRIQQRADLGCLGGADRLFVQKSSYKLRQTAAEGPVYHRGALPLLHFALLDAGSHNAAFVL